jgi:hypothetical protein
MAKSSGLGVVSAVLGKAAADNLLKLHSRFIPTFGLVLPANVELAWKSDSFGETDK